MCCNLGHHLISFQMQGNGVQLRPTPWPSFMGHTVSMHWQQSLPLVLRSVDEFLRRSIHFQHTNSLLIWEIDIQVSATSEDSIGAVGLQSPWLPPAMEPMLKEPQHHDSKLMTKILVEVQIWPLHLRIAMVFSTTKSSVILMINFLQPWTSLGHHTRPTSSALGGIYFGIKLIASVRPSPVGLLHLQHALLWQYWWPTTTLASQVQWHDVLELLIGGWFLDSTPWLQVSWGFDIIACAIVNLDGAWDFYLELDSRIYNHLQLYLVYT